MTYASNNTDILMIDDDAELGAMLSEYLAAEGYITSVVLNGEAGVDAALSGRYAAVILDIMLPRVGGIEVLRRIRQASRVPVIMLTAKGDNVDRVLGLEMGADDYMPKPCYPRELLARLRAVLRRTGAADNDRPLKNAGLTLSAAQRRASWQQEVLDLTVSEFNFLEILMQAGDRVVSKEELSELGLGRPRAQYDRSVDVHISNLRQKLFTVAQEAAQVETVRGVGYRLRCV